MEGLLFFLVYSACMNFFHFNFLLHDIFFCTSPPVFRERRPTTPKSLEGKKLRSEKVKLHGNYFRGWIGERLLLLRVRWGSLFPWIYHFSRRKVVNRVKNTTKLTRPNYPTVNSVNVGITENLFYFNEN